MAKGVFLDFKIQNMRKRIAYFTLLILFSFVVKAGPTDSLRAEIRDGNKFIVHRVVKGDNLTSLANKYAVSESQILSANPIISDKLHVGQIVRVPINEQKYGEVAIAPVEPLTQSNIPLAKSLPAPAPIHHADLGAAARTTTPPTSTLNNSKPAAQTTVVQAPTPSQTPPATASVQPENTAQTPGTAKEYKTYVVASPQSVNHLAASFGVDPQEIIELNKLKNYNLKEGQKVKIPLSTGTPALAKKTEPVTNPVVPASKPAEPAVAPVVAKTEPRKVQYREASSASKPVTKPEPVVVKVEPKPEPVVVKVEPKPEPVVAKVEPKPEPVVAKVEPKPEPKPVVAKVEPKPEPVVAKVVPKPEPKPVAKPVASPMPAIAAAPAPKVESKKLPDVKQESAKAEGMELDNDSMMLSILKKQRRKEALTDLDSDYIHPKGIAYKVFDYKETDYSYDLHYLLTAEENAIDVKTVNQRKGSGNKNTTHVVAKYETLQTIAKKYKISATDIINWNGLISYRVREGQELTINSARAEISPYVRTIPQAPEKNGYQIMDKKIVGLATYDPKMVQKRGVYVNGVEKGKFVYIICKDNFREHFARVLGPLPKGTPDGVVLILDSSSKRELHIEKSIVNVELFFGLFEQGTASNK